MMKSGKIVLAVKDEYKLKHDRAVEVADNNLARAMENDDFRRITKELSSLNFDVVLKQARKQDASDELQKIKLLAKERAKATFCRNSTAKRATTRACFRANSAIVSKSVITKLYAIFSASGKSEMSRFPTWIFQKSRTRNKEKSWNPTINFSKNIATNILP